MKCAILENRSTTTMIESLPRFVLGKPKMKSMLKSSQIDSGTGRGRYKPAFCPPPLYS
ncbi:hypothetical protein MA16_Dca028462 [Dendrobium catenatum]|uniref:Uncharacterized protein n=1 Tax=Dendrobium catenatum TaxID=906689 RepID=A0A2I0V6Z0_9ASPA|nr:hypothetical protein MA16_Dca028462 [Dendrobium catenatum]